MFQLEDYPQIHNGYTYVIAMAGGEGEEATEPIREYVERDVARVADENGITAREVLDGDTLEDWVDSLQIYDGDTLVARWNKRAGWN